MGDNSGQKCTGDLWGVIEWPNCGQTNLTWAIWANIWTVISYIIMLVTLLPTDAYSTYSYIIIM